MDDELFEHMVELSTIFLPVMRSRAILDGIVGLTDREESDILTPLQIVADTFVEMQRRLGIKPRFSFPSNMTGGE